MHLTGRSAQQRPTQARRYPLKASSDPHLENWDQSPFHHNETGSENKPTLAVAGVDVGKIDSIELSDGKARLTFRLDPEITVREDAKAAIRARSILGEKYLSIEPGSTEAPPLNGTHIDHSVGQVEIDQLLTKLGSVFDGIDPERLGTAVDALAAAFEQDPERPARIVENLETLVQELLNLAEQGSSLAREGQQAAESLGGLSNQAQSSLTRADQILADLELAVGHLPGTAEGLPLLMDDARGVAADMRELVHGLNAQQATIEKVLSNLSEIDKWELRRLLREEGILLRLRRSEVTPDSDAASERE